jgi:predicted transcriptional regulator
MDNTEKKAVDIMMSPCRVDILNSIFQASDGLTSNEIKMKMLKNLPNMSDHLEDHLEELIHKDIIEKKEDMKYVITNQGKKVYKQMQNIAKNIELTA